MKKNIISVIALLLIFSCVITVGCANDDGKVGSDKINIVTTIFPIYDWTREITRNVDEVSLKLLIDDGSDVHSFQASVDDIISISSCDILIYTGGESDRWIEDALKNRENEDMVVIKLMDIIGERHGLLCTDDSHCHGDGSDHEHHHGESVEYDEHVWLSVKNASVFSHKIASAVSAVDPKNAEIYKENSEAYIKKLEQLDSDFDELITESENNNLVFCDRFPFVYFAHDYSLNCFAAFPGCSTDVEASFETIAFLANKIDELQLKTVICLVGGDRKISDTVVANTKEKNQSVLFMNSLQNISASEAKNGVSYISIMEYNLDVLREALQ